MSFLYFTKFGIDFILKFEFFLLLSLVIIADKTNLCAMMMLFIMIHEMGHITGFILFKVKIKSISLHPFGIKIKRENNYKSLWKEILIYLLGPLFNLFSIIFIYIINSGSPKFQMAAAVNAVMLIFNLLPIGNLDGGNILKLILNKHTKAEKLDFIFKVVSLIVLAPLFAVAIFIALPQYRNPTLLITCCYLLYSCLS